MCFFSLLVSQSCVKLAFVHIDLYTFAPAMFCSIFFSFIRCHTLSSCIYMRVCVCAIFFSLKFCVDLHSECEMKVCPLHLIFWISLYAHRIERESKTRTAEWSINLCKNYRLCAMNKSSFWYTIDSNNFVLWLAHLFIKFHSYIETTFLLARIENRYSFIVSVCPLLFWFKIFRAKKKSKKKLFVSQWREIRRQKYCSKRIIIHKTHLNGMKQKKASRK